MNSWPWLATVVLGNSLYSYLVALLSFIGVLLALILVRKGAINRLRALAQHTKTDVDDFLIDLLENVRGLEWYLLAFYVSVRRLDFPDRGERALRALVIVAISYRVVMIIQATAKYTVDRIFAADHSPAHKSTARNISYFVSALLWISGLLFVLSNLGFNVTSMLAGLGIGGVAVALAAQAILADLFSAVAIFLDKPFVVGDTILVDGFVGTVERIGIKTTRVRSLSGELLVFSNSKLTSSNLQNFRDLTERRVVMTFGVPTRTPLEKLKSLPRHLESVIRGLDAVRFDRAHFKKFGEFDFTYEVVYYVLDADYNRFMDINQNVHFSVLEIFQKEGILPSLPTRTILQHNQTA